MTPVRDARDAAAKPDGSSHRPELPWLALRVGVTGARDLAPENIARLRDQLQVVLQKIKSNMERLGKEDGVAARYAGFEQELRAPSLRFISPLAHGADRLAAAVALDVGYQLYVPMPFPQNEYEQDFKSAEPDASRPDADLQEFRDLLAKAKADWLSLDGDRGDQDRAYEAVGEFVTRHSDVLIAIWDGKAWERRGGTAQIVEYAAFHGVPVWWIHATEPRVPVLLTDPEDLRDPLPLASEPPFATLETYLNKQIRPPGPVERDRHGFIGSIARRGQDRTESPIADYFAEKGTSPGAWSKLYGMMMRWASGRNLPWSDPARPNDSVARYWYDHYRPADARAGEYAARYRSTYVWLFLLATLVLAFATTAAVTHGHEQLRPLGIVMTVFELGTLILIGMFVRAAIRGEWHERFIEYRLLAELCRKQQFLAPLGRAVSLVAVRRMVLREMENAKTERVPTDAEAGEAEMRARAAWVAWLFAAWERAAPLPVEYIAKSLDEIVRTQVLDGLIDEQLRYHQGRADMSERADETFFRIGQESFIAVGVCVMVKLLVQGVALFIPAAEQLQGWEIFYLTLTWLAIVLPAVSAAALGIRSYAELQLLAEQSHHMLQELLHAKRRINRINLTRALAAEDIGAETQAVATLMLQDLDGWSRLFKVKAIEP
jgi:hypothetical protein